MNYWLKFMEDLLVHPKTKQQIEVLLAAKPHAVLLSGKAGAGKTTLALRVAEELLQSQNVHMHPYFLHITAENQSIGIDAVRRIADFVSKKTTGQAAIRRIILISDAQTMTTEAQNALLKTLEEPPEDTMLILTTVEQHLLRQTLRSRLQTVEVLPVNYSLAQDFYKQKGSPETLKTGYHISGGLPGLLTSLMEEATDHELVVAIAQAKQLLAAEPYERLLQVEALTKDRQKLALLLEALQRIALSGLHQAAESGNSEQLKRFHKLSDGLQSAYKAVDNNASPKLLLTHTFLGL